jgi:hypothetical protein
MVAALQQETLLLPSFWRDGPVVIRPKASAR